MVGSAGTCQPAAAARRSQARRRARPAYDAGVHLRPRLGVRMWDEPARLQTPPDSILVFPRIFLATPPLPGRSPLRPCEPARRNVEPPMVRPAPQPSCAHPSTRRRLRPASHCLAAAPLHWAAGGGVQRPQARCPRARTGSTSPTTTWRSPACRSPSSATPTRTPRPGPSSTTRPTASSLPNPQAHCGDPTRFRVRPLPLVRAPCPLAADDKASPLMTATHLSADNPTHSGRIPS